MLSQEEVRLAGENYGQQALDLCAGLAAILKNRRTKHGKVRTQRCGLEDVRRDPEGSTDFVTRKDRELSQKPDEFDSGTGNAPPLAQVYRPNRARHVQGVI